MGWMKKGVRTEVNNGRSNRETIQEINGTQSHASSTTEEDNNDHFRFAPENNCTMTKTQLTSTCSTIMLYLAACHQTRCDGHSSTRIVNVETRAVD